MRSKACLLYKKSPDTLAVFAFLMNNAVNGRHFDSNLNFHLPVFSGCKTPNDIKFQLEKIFTKKLAATVNENACLNYIADNTQTIFQPDITNNQGLFMCYKVQNSFDQEHTFQTVSHGKDTHFKYHGSNLANWFSIVTRGLQNYSNTKFMASGAAYGSGVYLSDEYSFSKTYSLSGEFSLLGVFSVVGAEDYYKKNNNIYVVPKPEFIILRYLIFTEKACDSVQWLNSYFRSSVVSPPISIAGGPLKKKGVKRLLAEVKKITSTGDTGIQVEFYNDDLTNWLIRISDFTPGSGIEQDMKRLGVKEIILQGIFAEDYPFYPPFIRVISPRFCQGTGHITASGAICMELLTPNNWSQIMTMENVLMQIKSLVIEGSGRISDAKANYQSLTEAKQSFLQVAKSHGWI